MANDNSATSGSGAIMPKSIAQLNIEHYRQLLATALDETKRQTIQKLLAEEEAKLAQIDQPPERKRG
jgi:hypothetical protein